MRIVQYGDMHFYTNNARTVRNKSQELFDFLRYNKNAGGDIDLNLCLMKRSDYHI